MVGTVECLQTRFRPCRLSPQTPPKPVQRQPFAPLPGRAPFFGDCAQPGRGALRCEQLVLVTEQAKG